MATILRPQPTNVFAPARLLQQFNRGASLPKTSLTLDLDARYDVYKDTSFATPATADGDTIAGWKDQSGVHNNFTQATSAARPVLRLNKINGLPALQFASSSSQVLASTNTLANILTTSAFTLYVVFNPTSISSANANAFQNDGIIQGSTSFMGLYLKSTPVAVIYTFDGANKSAQSTISTSAFQVVQARHDSGSLVISTNNGTESSSACGNQSGGTGGALQVGEGSAHFLTGFISRLIAYNIAHTSAQRTAVYSYLTSTYGIP